MFSGNLLLINKIITNVIVIFWKTLSLAFSLNSEHYKISVNNRSYKSLIETENILV